MKSKGSCDGQAKFLLNQTVFTKSNKTIKLHNSKYHISKYKITRGYWKQIKMMESITISSQLIEITRLVPDWPYLVEFYIFTL